ncbi:TPA: DUF943 family protein [Proteus mirabilis]|nr:DUF943 family protein [Proteus mirabilis]HEK0625293.1 DUF943 family protein [Proteus mirabilis]
MAFKYKITIIIFLLSFIFFVVYEFFIPVKVMGVHKDTYTTSILVEDFPITDYGKIIWWKKNKVILDEQYNLFKAKDSSFYIYIWNYGDGYLEEGKYDRLCFTEIKSNKRCIEKDNLMLIKNYLNEEEIRIGNSAYIKDKNGSFIKKDKDANTTITVVPNA